MPETMGCQLKGIMTRFLTYDPLSAKELDAMKRRMFGFMDIMEKHAYTIAWIQEIDTLDEMRSTINELTPFEVGEMFF